MSYYAVLGGSHPYTDSGMRRNVVDEVFGESNYDVITMWDKGYDELEKKIGTDGELLYRSSSYQGYARLSPCRKYIKAAILVTGSIHGVIYVKK